MARYLTDIIDVVTSRQLDWVSVAKGTGDSCRLIMSVYDDETETVEKLGINSLSEDIRGVELIDNVWYLVQCSPQDIAVLKMIQFENFTPKLSNTWSFVNDSYGDIVLLITSGYVLISKLIIQDVRCVVINSDCINLETSKGVYTYRIIDDNFINKLTKVRLCYV